MTLTSFGAIAQILDLDNDLGHHLAARSQP